MRLPRVRFSVGGMMAGIAVIAFLTYFVAIPAWDYYSLPPGTRAVLAALRRPVRFPSAGRMPLADLLRAVRVASAGPKGTGIPVYVDPKGLADADAGVKSPVVVPAGRAPIKDRLDRSLGPLRLGYYVKDGLLTITSARSARLALETDPKAARRP